MGAVQSWAYPNSIVEVAPPESPDESGIMRNNACVKESGGRLFETWPFTAACKTPIAIVAAGAEKWADMDCLGERMVRADGTMGEYRWISWKCVYERFIQFGRGLTKIGVKKGDRVGVFGSNSIWWQTVNFGTQSIGAVTVPVYDSLGPHASEYICEFAEIQVLFASEFKFQNALGLISSVPTIRKLGIMAHALPNVEGFVSNGVELMTAEEVLALGENGVGYGESDFPNPSDMAMLFFTSGSTGTPKGVMLSHANVVAGSAGLSIVGTSCTPGWDTYLSFLPLAHVYAHAVELEVFACGGRVGYAQGTVANLMSDVQALQPTIMTTAPRVLNRVAEGMKSKLAAKPWIVQRVMKWAMDQKVRCMKENRAHSLVLDVLLAPFREALGGKLRVLISGGAPIMPEILEFCSATVTPNIFQGCGMTELASSMFVQSIPIRDTMSVGSVCPCCEIKLRRVADLPQYDPQAAEPAGEILVRGHNVMMGYYRQEDLTRESFLPGGWFATGDVALITSERQARLVDRVKALMKLSQGEYISLNQLTEYYSMAPVVSFIFVHAEGLYSEPVAIVWPRREMVEAWQSRGLDVEHASQVHDEIVQSLKAEHAKRQLRGFERINHVLVKVDEPSVENGLLTPTLKAQRKKIAAKYKAELDALYASFS